MTNDIIVLQLMKIYFNNNEFFTKRNITFIDFMEKYYKYLRVFNRLEENEKNI